MKGRFYLAGPMTGLPDLNFPAFHRDAAWLRGRGYEIVNPAEVNPDPTAKWADCMKQDIAELVNCLGVFMMPGWEKSKGARLEHYIATMLEMKIVYLVRDEAAVRVEA
jgi:hypothetical protein